MDDIKNASSGDGAQNASSGNDAKNASSGYGAQNASSGDYAQNASSGGNAKNASSGNHTKTVITGEHSISADIGWGSTVQAVLGTWIGLAEYDDRGVVIFAKFEVIDDITLFSGVEYKLKDKEFVEV